jgi:hypothetical protein
MIFLLTWDGALKWLFLFFLREEVTILLNFILKACKLSRLAIYRIFYTGNWGIGSGGIIVKINGVNKHRMCIQASWKITQWHWLKYNTNHISIKKYSSYERKSPFYWTSSWRPVSFHVWPTTGKHDLSFDFVCLTCSIYISCIFEQFKPGNWGIGSGGIIVKINGVNKHQMCIQASWKITQWHWLKYNTNHISIKKSW